jgi:UDP-glucose 4-epimerase
MLAARAPEDAFGRAFNIGGGAPEPTTINEVLRSVAELCGVDADPVHEAARPGDVRTTRADVSLARHLLGYAPAVSVEEGLRRTVASFSAQGS